MTANIDFTKLKAQTMGHGDDEEAVTVNTRALIDKVLARYSGEWTVLRELLQNAADASARKVIVRFETLPSTTVPAPSTSDSSTVLKHVISRHTLKRLIVTNDGAPFTANDWARLKRIAEGNPDETKIGAFGVGFYSVFSDCEEPLVSSGPEAMAFHWKGNALFTKRLKLPESEASPLTSFVLDYRSTTSPVPALVPLCQFLSGSLTFSGLEEIELLLDDWRLLSLRKKVSPGVDVSLPKGIVTRTPGGLLKITKVSREIAQMDASVTKAVSWKPPNAIARLGETTVDKTRAIRSFFSRFTRASSGTSEATEDIDSPENTSAADVTSTSSSSIFFTICTAHLQSSVSSSFSKELERATKKSLPRTTTIALLTSSFQANGSFYSSTSSGASDVDIFASVLPSKGGRVFIGFSTHQTTGLNAHVSAPALIPTVERESIDLNARWVRDWNIEILRAVGITCRIEMFTEMEHLKGRLPPVTGNYRNKTEDVIALVPEAIYISNQFVFREATPSARVGEVLEDSFWTCDHNAYFEVLSSCGILPTSQVRIAPKDLNFLTGTPVLLEEYSSGASEFVRRLTDFGLITQVTFADIRRELENAALNPKTLVEFIGWAARKASTIELDTPFLQGLLKVAVAVIPSGDGNPEQILCLGDIRYYINASRIPVDLPTPSTVMPFKYTSNMSASSLQSLGWRELQIDEWVAWLIENSENKTILSPEQDMTRSPAFAARVLPVVSKHWDSLSVNGKLKLLNLLKENSIIPTKLGMMKPRETYFPSVRLFDDLPIVTGLNGVKEKFLVGLGVRKTVGLDVIFERLLSDQHSGDDDKGRRKWSHVDLMKYLASVRNDIPSDDLGKLREAKFCSAEFSGGSDAGLRFRVRDLYEPDPALRDLGLPVIQWPGQYSPQSPEGSFLSVLGLKKHPNTNDLVRLMTEAAVKKDTPRRERAMGYFIRQHVANGYRNLDASRISIPFLPLESSDNLSTPSNCFTDDEARLFGVQILRKSLHPHASKLGVQKHPPLTTCLSILRQKPPTGKKDARVYFEYFSGRLGELDSSLAHTFGHSPIVPIMRQTANSKPSVSYISPSECYLGDNEDYGEIFDFVDFGQEANMFLMACGSKREPTKLEVAASMVREPASILSKLGTVDKYLKLLRHIAENQSVVQKNRQLFKEMINAPFLLVSREVKTSSTSRDTKLVELDYDDDGYNSTISTGTRMWQLARARDCIIVDDYSSYNLFKENLLAAPQDELFEGLYLNLGAPPLSSMVEHLSRRGTLAADQKPALKVKKQIFERSRLFLHDQPRDSVKHDSRWLENNLEVQIVTSIELQRTLKGYNISHTEKRSAVVSRSHLYIASQALDYYQISQALVQLMLYRPKLHFTLTLEMLLKTDLLELRARGYNVERILQVRAAEAKIAEDQRKKQLDYEQQQEMERALSRIQAVQGESHARKDIRNEAMPHTPGGFPERPQSENSIPSPGESGGGDSGFISGMTRRLGEIRDNLQNVVNQNPTNPLSHSASAGTRGGGDLKSSSNPVPLENNLQSAIKSCRPYGSSSLYARGETNVVSESHSYCDERPRQALELIGTTPTGIKIFISKSYPDKSSFMSLKQEELAAFETVLADCARTFNLDVNALCIFHDPENKTIGFNGSGSIFCNFSYFQQLHSSSIIQQSAGRTDALVYWWVILCHELAHNLVSDHSSTHSFYTESFVAQYFTRVAVVCTGYKEYSF